MGTRSIIVIHDGKKLNRVYKHYDGYPSQNLHVIYTAISQGGQMAEIAKNVCEIGEGCTRIEHEADNAVLNKENLGNQADLEWVYVVDIKKRNIDVFGGSYSGKIPSRIMNDGKANVYYTAGSEEITEIKEAVNNLKDIGYTINHK